MLAWGLLSIGAVYPWGYQPLLVACGATAVLEGVRALGSKRTESRVVGMARTRRGDAVAVALACFCAAIVIQLVPFPSSVLAAISAGLDAFLREHDLGYAAVVAGIPGLVDRHPLSIDPAATTRGLIFVVTLSAWFLALRSAFRHEGTVRFIRAIGVIALVVALFAIVQRATFNGRVYWLWTPREGMGNPFGPFINHNHFATWMLLALSLQVGRLCALTERARNRRVRTLRERVVWLSSREASEAMLVGFAVVICGLAIVLSLSRSGIGGFVTLTALMASMRIRRSAKRPAAVLVTMFLVAVPGLTIAWAGFDAVGGRFARVAVEAPFRVGIWRDTVRMIRDMPLTGTGFNTFGTASPYYQSIEPTLHFAEAHNDYLQLASEGGVLLLVPAACVVAAFCRQVARRFAARADDQATSWIRAGAVAGLVAVSVQSLVEFGLQIPANAALFGTVAAIASHETTLRRAAAGQGRTLVESHRHFGNG